VVQLEWFQEDYGQIRAHSLLQHPWTAEIRSAEAAGPLLLFTPQLLWLAFELDRGQLSWSGPAFHAASADFSSSALTVVFSPSVGSPLERTATVRRLWRALRGAVTRRAAVSGVALRANIVIKEGGGGGGWCGEAAAWMWIRNCLKVPKKLDVPRR
jgi:hypothetical protein